MFTMQYYIQQHEATTTCNNIGELYSYIAEPKKPDTEDYIIYYSVYLKFRDRQNRSVVLGSQTSLQ